MAGVRREAAFGGRSCVLQWLGAPVLAEGSGAERGGREVCCAEEPVRGEEQGPLPDLAHVRVHGADARGDLRYRPEVGGGEKEESV